MRNEQERLAREWAERKLYTAQRHLEDAGYHTNPDTIAAAEYILATTTPPTMADVEWDHGAHCLAGVETGYEDAVMLHRHGRNMIVLYDLNTGGINFCDRSDLTPNGKRYELREVVEPEHPETLTTVEDYENAPEGTIVASNGKWEVPFMKQNGLWRRNGISFSNNDMSQGHEHWVLRWGWGE